MFLPSRDKAGKESLMMMSGFYIIFTHYLLLFETTSSTMIPL